MRAKSAAIFLLLIGAAHPARSETALPDTSLYRNIAHGCRALDLEHWSHPMGGVLMRAHAVIDKVELCNADKYPVFTVHFSYDPAGPNDTYYNKLFAEMIVANGYHPYSIVDLSFDYIRNISVKGKRQISISNEEFDTPEAETPK